MSNRESSDGEDAEERFFHDNWDGDDGRLHEEDDSDQEEDNDADPYGEAFMRDGLPLHELDGEMVNWYARNHERYIKNLINGEPVEDYGLSIPQVAAAAAADAAGDNDIGVNNAGEAQMAEENLRIILSLGPTFGDSTRGRGVSCELKSGVVIQYNQSFMPLWTHYTDGLRDCRILRLFEEFSIYKIHLKRSLGSLMFTALIVKNLKKLTICETEFCSEGFASLTE